MVPPEHFARIEALFLDALERAPAERAAFVAGACGGDAELRRQVEQLLAGHAAAGEDFLAVGESSAVAELPAIGSRIAGYRLTRVLAAGGMGTVYEAEGEAPHRTVALKVMRPGLLSSTAIRRFEVEAEILGRLHHPGVAQVYAAGTHRAGALPVPWFAMELVEGALPITEWCDRQRTPVAARLALLAEVCDAVHHGHQKGVVHRDLKPANLLIDERGRPKVIDFGVARVAGAGVTLATLTTGGPHLIGTLAYMSPEQCAGDGRDVDVRSDVYALGVVLFELLCGQLPHDLDGRPLPQVVRAIQDEAPRRPSSLRPELAGDAEAIVQKALEKDRSRRYQSAAELAQDVRRFLARQPILARPPSWTYRLRLLARRHRMAVAAAAALLVVLVAATVVSSGFAVHAAARAAEAEHERDTSAEMLAFLEDLLKSADPERYGGTLTVRQMLDVAAERIERELQRRPLVQARLRSTIAESYRRLSCLEEARQHGAAALRALRAAPGEQRLALAAALESVGLTEMQLGKLGEARAALDESLAIRAAALGQDDLLVARTLNGLGSLELREGHVDAAEQQHRRALALRRRALAPSDAVVAESLTNLGTVLYQRGEAAAAEPLWREALAAHRAEGRARYPQAARVATFLGLALWRKGELAAAEQAMREGLAVLRECYPPGHRLIGDALEKLAFVQQDSGQGSLAAATLREVLELRRKAGGDEEASVPLARCALGYCLLQQGELDEAHAELTAAEAVQRRILPTGHPDLAGTLTLLGRVETQRGEAALAEPRLREALAIRERALGAGNPRTAVTRSALGECLLAQGMTGAAAALLTESWTVIDKTFRSTESEHRAARERMRKLYEALGQPEQAARLLR